MVGVTVTFDYTDGFDRSRVVKVAENARAVFEGMPGLRYKFFTLDPEQGRAMYFYVWDSEEAARRLLPSRATRAGYRALRYRAHNCFCGNSGNGRKQGGQSLTDVCRRASMARVRRGDATSSVLGRYERGSFSP